MEIKDKEVRKETIGYEEMIKEVGKELGYRKYLYPQKIKANPSRKVELENRYLAMEKVYELLKEISSSSNFYIN